MKILKEKTLESTNGITLIALVVTIIILLILAGISISMLSGDNSILQKATDAKKLTGIGQEKETVVLAYNSALAKKVSNGDSSAVTAGDLNQELTNQGASANGNNPIKVTFTDSQRQYTINSNGLIDYAGIKNEDATKKIKDLEIGDYVRYGDKLTVNTYQTNASLNQTFETDTQMLWRVMNKKENEDVELVAVSNVLDNGETNINYKINGEPVQYLGLFINNFLTAETLLNDLCDELYSSDYGIARSINIDDINNLNNFNPETDSWTDLDSESFVTIRSYGVSVEYTSGPVWNAENNEINTASSSNPLNVRNTHYSYYLPSNMPLYDTLSASIQSNALTSYYWLASRCWNANNSGNKWAYNYNMRVRFIGMGTNQTSGASVRDWSSYSTNMGGYELSGPGMCGVRPVVTLDGSINIQNDSTKDGKSEAKAYLLE